MALEPTTLLASLAAIIVLGYLGSRLFDRTRIPDILLLVGLGVLLGPVLMLLDPAVFTAVAPVLGTFTLLIILFDGGLSLKLGELVHGMARASALAIGGWVLTVAAIAGVAVYYLGWDPLVGALLGAILGGASSIVVIPLVARLRVADQARVTLSVESALTDVLCIVGSLTIIGMITSGYADVGGFLRSVASQFSVAIVAGALAGIGWALLWKVLERGTYAYMITLAAVLLLHLGVEFIGGNGPIAVLSFGVILGNRRAVLRSWVSGAWEVGGDMRRFHAEVAFVIRAFFFVSLGILLDPTVLSRPGFPTIVVVLVGAIVAARVVSVGLATAGSEKLKGSKGLLALMMPRGLAAAVLAGIPAQLGIAGTQDFVAYAFGVIVLTNLAVTAGAVAIKPATKEGKEPVVGGAAEADAQKEVGELAAAAEEAEEEQGKAPRRPREERAGQGARAERDEREERRP